MQADDAGMPWLTLGDVCILDNNMQKKGVMLVQCEGGECQTSRRDRIPAI